MTNPTPQHPEETHPERRARHFAMLRELADLNMVAARDAAARIQTAGPETSDAASPTLALARATRAVTQLINLETRLATNQSLEPRAHDPGREAQRETLRQTLYPFARDPDPATRAARRRQIDTAIDDALDLDLDDDLPIAHYALAVAHALDLPLDLARLPDELLGLTRPIIPNARASPQPP